MVGLLRSEGVWAGRGVLAAAPSIADSKALPFTTGATAHSFATSGLDTSTGRSFAFLGWLASSASFTSFTGDGGTADTSASLALYDTNPRTYLREVTVNGVLDANWVLTVGASCRALMHALVIDGIGSVPTPAVKTGAGATLPNCDAFGVTGGPKSMLVVDAAMLAGAHETNPPTAPAGFTTLDTHLETGSNNPTSTSHGTMAIAYKTYDAAGLTWTAGAATIPASSFQGLADIGAMNWRTIRAVFMAP